MTDGFHPRGTPDALDKFATFTGRFMGGPPQPQHEDDYEPAPREFSLAQARGMLARLYGVEVQHLTAVADPAVCGECGRVTLLFQYGKFTLCRGCALRRRRVFERFAAEREAA